jgi:DNA polymerase IV
MASHWVLHVDLDEFIAAVEVLRRPELAGKPVVVGGRGDPTERGVVSTASYEARAFGVGSGMPLRVAARKCPEAVFLPVDKAAYDEASARVMDTLRSLGVPVEVLGWDEAFLGVDARDPEAFAGRLRQAVLDATQLHSSVGIGDNKLRAKLATGFGKPRGIFRLTADNWDDVMADRPTAALWGIGKRTANRLASLGFTTVRELAAADPAQLAAQLGPTMGPWYRQLARGIGDSVVDESPYLSRGRSRETTFQENLTAWPDIEAEVRRLAGQVADDVLREGRPAVRLTLKVRYAPFFTKTHSRKLPTPTSSAEDITAVALHLAGGLERDRPVRLLGLRAEMSMPAAAC